MKKIITLIFAITLLSSCNKTDDDCLGAFPSIPELYISIVNAEGISLIGEGNVYKPSEITLSNATQNIPLSTVANEEIIYIVLNYGEMQSLTDYNFKLNDQETDILNLTINLIDAPCNNFLRIDSFKVNNQEIMPVSNLYTIRK